MDTFRQQYLQRTVISQTRSPFDVESHSIALDANNMQPEPSLRRGPFCFVADTNSTSFIIDDPIGPGVYDELSAVGVGN